MSQRLLELLKAIRAKAGSEFSGIGLVIVDSAAQLPIISLSAHPKPAGSSDLVEVLTEISIRSSPLHDGFHILSPEYELMHVAQYFSPPIVANAKIDRRKRVGGRYAAAMFGSAIPGVILTGIASNDFGIATFQSGMERYFEASE